MSDTFGPRLIHEFTAAAEIAACREKFREDHDKATSFLVAPDGHRFSRVVLAGQLEPTPAEETDNGMLRATLLDATGKHVRLYAGQYSSPQAQQFLAKAQPGLVVVIGRAELNEYTREGATEASKYPRVRAEHVRVVQPDEYRKILAMGIRHGASRLRQGTADPRLLVDEKAKTPLRGIREGLRTGIAKLNGPTPEAQPMPRTTPPTAPAAAPAPTMAPAPKPNTPKAPSAPTPEQTALDAAVLQTVERLVKADPKGARWDDVLQAHKEHNGEVIEGSLNRLMDAGKVYEPTLGILRTP